MKVMLDMFCHAAPQFNHAPQRTASDVMLAVECDNRGNWVE